MSKLWYRCLLPSLLLFLASSLPAWAGDKVVLQLKWEHEFQFAGFYAAQWQGYYAEEGLQVEIRSAAMPSGQFLSSLEELTSGRADFAVGGTDVFLYRGQGHDVKVLAPIFQRSPAGLFSLQETPMSSLPEAANLRIISVPSDETYLEARAMFYMNGIDPNRVDFIDAPVSLDSLQQGLADAVVTYGISARIRAQELGVDLNELTPNDHGIQFYGDILYTTGRMVRENPQLAEKFLRASLRGWRYALEHRLDIADRIAKELPRYIYHYDDFQQYNRAFSRLIDDYTYYPIVELGQIDRQRWHRTYDILERLGEIDIPFDPDDLLYNKPFNYHAHTPILMWAVAALSIAMVFLWSWRYQSNQWQLASLVGLVILVEQGLEAWNHHEQHTQQSVKVLERLSQVRSDIEQVLARNLAELNGIAAYIAVNPDLTQQEFESYARAVLKLDPQIINLAAAPDLVVKYIYPLLGNEAALGLNYRNNPAQLPAVMRALELGSPIIAGPVDLVQGGKAFIGRAPVRIIQAGGAITDWGIVSAPIDVAAVYREAGLLDPELGLKVAIRGKDGRGFSGELFYGHEDIFSHPESVTQTVSINGGSWQIAAIPNETNHPLTARLIIIRTAALVVILLVLLLLSAQRRNLETFKQHQAVLRRNAKFMREVETVARIGGWRMEHDGTITELSEQARQLLHISEMPKSLTLEAFARLISPNEQKEIIFHLQESLRTGNNMATEVKAKDGKTWLRVIGDPMDDDDDGNREILGAIQDITDKKVAEEKIEHQANYDNLTDLPNRKLFRDRLETSITRARRSGHSVVLLFVDLDNFKAVNDTFGHFVGDQVLQQAAERIQGCIRESDTVGRHSGDEFTVILDDISNHTAIDKIAEKLVAELNRAFLVGRREAYCGASIGVAIYPGDADNADTLLVNADQAMYEVKKSGRNNWSYYTDELQRRAEYRHQLYNNLKSAMRNDELCVFLQPIVDTASGRTVGCEALARWQRADGSWVPPNEFIPFAEETDLINQLDYQLSERAITALRRINSERQIPLQLSLNISPRLLHTDSQILHDWQELVITALKTVPLNIEITERLLIEESERSSGILQTLSSSGANISIDDFGTGYSSLGYLTRFPVTGLKIDRSFVNGIGEHTATEQIIETILAMASKLDMGVVAEGVETREQLQYLKELQCDRVQGFYLGLPMSVENFMTRLEEEDQPENALNAESQPASNH